MAATPSHHHRPLRHRVATATATMGVTAAGTAMVWAGVFGGAGTASADALCDQLRAQYGPGWPCVSVPSPPPTPDVPSPAPTLPGQDPGTGGPHAGANPGPGPGVGNGTPLIPAVPALTTPPAHGNGDGGQPPTPPPPSSSPHPGGGGGGGTDSPAPPTAPAPDPTTATPEATSTDPNTAAPATGARQFVSDAAHTASALGTDHPSTPIPAAAWLVAGAAALTAARPHKTASAARTTMSATKRTLTPATVSAPAAGRTRSLVSGILPTGGSERATLGTMRLVLLNDASSAHTQVFDMDVPPGGYTVINPDGSATVYDKNGNHVRSVMPPWAYDSLGRPQRTWYTTDADGNLVQHVEPETNALYPILADPNDEWDALLTDTRAQGPPSSPEQAANMKAAQQEQAAEPSYDNPDLADMIVPDDSGPSSGAENLPTAPPPDSGAGYPESMNSMLTEGGQEPLPITEPDYDNPELADTLTTGIDDNTPTPTEPGPTQGAEPAPGQTLGYDDWLNNNLGGQDVGQDAPPQEPHYDNPGLAQLIVPDDNMGSGTQERTPGPYSGYPESLDHMFESAGYGTEVVTTDNEALRDGAIAPEPGAVVQAIVDADGNKVGERHTTPDGRVKTIIPDNNGGVVVDWGTGNPPIYFYKNGATERIFADPITGNPIREIANPSTGEWTKTGTDSNGNPFRETFDPDTGIKVHTTETGTVITNTTTGQSIITRTGVEGATVSAPGQPTQHLTVSDTSWADYQDLLMQGADLDATGQSFGNRFGDALSTNATSIPTLEGASAQTLADVLTQSKLAWAPGADDIKLAKIGKASPLLSALGTGGAIRSDLDGGMSAPKAVISETAGLAAGTIAAGLVTAGVTSSAWGASLGSFVGPVGFGIGGAAGFLAGVSVATAIQAVWK